MDSLNEGHSYPSYSQCGEDRILYWLFERLGNVHGLRYLDVGASAPVGHNNTYLFYTLGGTGVLVEADPMYRDAYAELRPRDHIETLAVVPTRFSHNDTIDFHRMKDRGWSSISMKHVELGRELGKTSDDVESIRVPCCTINQLMRRHFATGSFDILSLDVEGVDSEILAEADLSTFQPKVVVVENANNPLAANSSPLRLRNYDLFASTFVNSVYIHRKLLTHLPI